MGYLDADRTYAYDTLDRVLTARLTDTQNWTAAVAKTSWCQYDDQCKRIFAVDREWNGELDHSASDPAVAVLSWNGNRRVSGLDRYL